MTNHIDFLLKTISTLYNNYKVMQCQVKETRLRNTYPISIYLLQFCSMINVQYFYIKILLKNNMKKYNQTTVYIGVWAHFLKIIAAWNYMSALQLFIILLWFECIYLSTFIYVRQSWAINLFQNSRDNQTISNTTKESNHISCG